MKCNSSSEEPAEECQDNSRLLVFKQFKDVVMTQKKIMDGLHSEVKMMKSSTVDQTVIDRLQGELEDERREHEKTKAQLADQTDKLQFALGEIEILTAQLTREKKLFEESFGKISDRVKRESSKSLQLETQCTTIKAEKEKQEEIMAFKDAKISDLKKRLASQKENHQRHLADINIQMQQEAYISRSLATKQGRARTGKNSALR